ncbi:MAG: hypothetical protein QOE31_494, partial [Solirubrobacteraceae bacterium]|nr:hypothetical protein [Solirubrobacteraceae bacterium]
MGGSRRTPRATLAATAAIVLLLAAVCAHSAAQTRDAAEHADAVDAGSRVDLAGARLEQVAGGELELQIDLHGPLDPADVKPSATR